MEWLQMERWPPYVCGAGIGLLSWLAFLLSDKTIGCSTAFARTSGMIEKMIRGRIVLDKPYYRKFAPEIDWEWMLVLGVLLGSFASAVAAGQFQWNWVPHRWAAHFGETPFLRWVTALIGGVVMGLGASWAGGCTSGHGISGTLQLAVSSWIAAVCFFIGGIATAKILY
ncbi:MAG: YeeE/YedE family protein [Deltaproteobacteria bacterium]|nr:YeeE/YedE family protein [Deltaproteobacteria bacterium]